ncbi:MAG: hypothetical protein KC546_21495, partial [Anaerolineae bacterium]|nr:hypothetical protein [Anaerolineae bacterium]
RVLSGQHLRAYDGAVAALVGLSIHHLFDMSLQYVALLVVIFITLVITPVAPVRIDKPIVRRASVASIILLSIGLLLGALWHIPTNSQYLDFIKSYQLQQAEGSVDYVDLMREMQSFINADPENRVYRIQYAVLAGEYAYQTNINDDITIAINAHQTVLQQIPQFSIVWSNLAGLYWQAGEIDAAKEAARNAMNYAEDWPVPRWQYASLSGSWQYPWHLDQLYWRYTKGSLQFMYLHDITEPLILPQVADSLTVPSDTLQRIAMNGILAVMGSGG